MALTIAKGPAGLPAAQRARKSGRSAEELAEGRALLAELAKLGLHSDYASAVKANAVVTDGQDYADKPAVRNAAQRTVALFRAVVGPDWHEASFRLITGRTGKDQPFRYGVFLAPYSEPKTRNRTASAPEEAAAAE